MLLVHLKKAFPITLLVHSFERRVLITVFFLKITMVFPIPTQVKQTEDGEHFANVKN